MERLIDKNKVIKGIEICSGITKESSEECPYWKALDMGCKSATCISTMMREARTLLKEQEPKPIKVVKTEYNHELYYCPRCNRPFCDLYYIKPKFCDKCGQEVKWYADDKGD